ncbi:outer membrane protein transport protein [Pseudenhygromyxa sp. WMMC2535]|uniref:OmpP1/FadL family transporter n=1 Tax=Pseudenhygromyxa sp. WMMC2535 TaxID=2712867 RepID=UPI0015566398|nr:outer membrane protein transport protein [Pseudenhygromyxa sp. WMMC2535]NVB36674.1 outer membrane protein transport protein [Pseudenhygromyxa sp. WMMC2535]
MTAPSPRLSQRKLSSLSSLSTAALVGGACLGLGLCLWSSPAQASGISTARFGGEHGHPTTENATAIYYNPGAIALSKGTHVYVDGMMALRWVSYDRPASAVDTQNKVEGAPNVSLDYAPGANDGKASLFNVAGAPYLGVTSDFGTDLVYAGASFSVPFGGGASWNKNERYANSELYPGAYDGQQRWFAIDGNLRSMYFTGAIAFKIKPAKLTIGFSGSAIYSSLDTVRARNADSSDNLVSGTSEENFTLKEGRSWLKASGWQGGFGVGLTAEPIDDVLWIGASYTSQPNVSGGMTLKGTLTNIFGASPAADTTEIELTQSMPDIVRFGFRVRPIPKLELRMFGDYTRWSVLDKQCVLIADVDDRKCEFANADTALEDPSSFGGDGGEDTLGVTQHLPRFWKDAGGVRVGVGYWFVPELETYLGVGYDSSAIPPETVDPVLFDMDKVSVSIGALWQAHRHVAMGATITQLIYFPLDTKGRSVFDDFQSPTRQPSADGVYKQAMTVGNLYLDLSF